MRARYCSPASGRFTAPDTLFPGGPGTQGYNRYAFVANNPTTWADPSGHFQPSPGYEDILKRFGGHTLVPVTAEELVEDSPQLRSEACLDTDWCAEAAAEVVAKAEAEGGPFGRSIS